MDARIWCLALVMACGPGGDSVQVVNEGGDGEEIEEVDEDGPVIEHVPIDSAQTFREPVSLSATVTDELSEVDSVSVLYRVPANERDWHEQPMSLGDAESGSWSGEIPGPDVVGGGIEYFIEAVDSMGNETFMPADGESDPYYFSVSG